MRQVGEFKLLKVVDGLCHFAHVTVRASQAENGVEGLEAISTPVRWEDGEVDRTQWPDWIDATLQGARDCGEALIDRGDLTGCRIEVMRVVGVEVDPIPADLQGAAFLATWTALMPGVPLPAFSFEDGAWRIDLSSAALNVQR